MLRSFITKYSLSLTVIPVLLFATFGLLLWSNVEFYTEYYVPTGEDFSRYTCQVVDCRRVEEYCPDSESTCTRMYLDLLLDNSVYTIVPDHDCDYYHVNQTLDCTHKEDIWSTLKIAPTKNDNRRLYLILFNLGIVLVGVLVLLLAIGIVTIDCLRKPNRYR